MVAQAFDTLLHHHPHRAGIRRHPKDHNTCLEKLGLGLAGLDSLSSTFVVFSHLLNYTYSIFHILLEIGLRIYLCTSTDTQIRSNPLEDI